MKTDDEVMHFLMAVAAYVAELHARSRRPGAETNAGVRFSDDSIPWEEEGFSRWMGWRGPDEQEREIRNVRERQQKRES